MIKNPIFGHSNVFQFHNEQVLGVWYESEADATRITLQQESCSYLIPFKRYGNFNSIK